MSTRERAEVIFDSLTEEQLEEFIEYFENYEQNDKDYENYVWEKLHEADELAKKTSVRYTHEEVFGKLRNKARER